MAYDADATLTSKGQITVPARIRERLGVRPGDRSGAFFQFFNLPTEFLGATPVKGFARRREHLVLFAIYVLLHQILELGYSFQSLEFVGWQL